MNEYLNRGIKEIITEFPEIDGILNDYEISCGPCSVGTCLLKDIVTIHRLTKDQEQELMARIAKAIHPGKDIKIPEIEKRTEVKPKEFRYAPPIKKLVDEHVLIKRWIGLIPQVVDYCDLKTEEGRQLILDGVDLIRSYADRFHHAKEEDILFKYFDENSDIIKVMYEDHTRARGYVKAVLDALDKGDATAISENLMAYRELLTEHIKKEDEILYPWMDNNLSTIQVGKLYSQFTKADKEIGFSPEKYERFIINLEEKFKQKEK